MIKGILKAEDGSIDEFYNWIDFGHTAKTNELVIETECGDVVITAMENGHIEIGTPDR